MNWPDLIEKMVTVVLIAWLVLYALLLAWILFGPDYGTGVLNGK